MAHLNETISTVFFLFPDIMSMMMQYSDLSAPQKAKGFQKPAIRDVAPKPTRAQTFQQSQKAKSWNQTQETYSGMFVGK